MKNEKYVLINSQGQIVRNIFWAGNKATVVYFSENNSVELINDVSQIDSNYKPYTVIAEVTKEQIKKKPLIINKNIKLSVHNKETMFVPTVLADKEEEKFSSTLRWTALTHFSLLFLLLVFGYFYSKQEKLPEVVVKVAQQQKLKKQKIRTVDVKKKKIKKLKKYAKSNHIKKKTPSKVNRKLKMAKSHSPGKKIKSVVNSGVLGALAGLHAGKNRPHLKLGSVNGQQTKEIGTGNLGGHSRAVYGKALVASQPGKGNNIGSIEKYNTRGQGGGQSGYGKIAIGGSEGIYSAPLNEEALIEGGLDRSQIDAVIKRNIGQITYCYERGLQKEPQLSGRVAIRFIIAPSGSVSLAKVHNSSLKSKSVEGCMVAKLKSWTFPKPYGNVNVKVTYPFSLRRVGVTNLSKRSL
ncbi:MAG: AgmX/PglI C-terminal domain-containing protein [Bdellovibrionales bacterium]|nr:AgmX/PglI C-terminal domain-containing protein [Bdellovibrionales bacterium]